MSFVLFITCAPDIFNIYISRSEFQPGGNFVCSEKIAIYSFSTIVFSLSVFCPFQICPFDTFIIPLGDRAFELFVIAIKDNSIPGNSVFLPKGNPALGKFRAIVRVIAIFVKNAV